MKVKTTLMALSLTGAAALALPAAADNQGLSGAAAGSTGLSKPIDNPEITRLDKDKDGVISKKEAKADKQLSKQWDSLDANADGKLDPMELARSGSGGMDGAPAQGGGTLTR